MMNFRMWRRRFEWPGLVIALILVVAGSAHGQGLEYSEIDAMTVRVLALGDVELVKVERKGETVHFAAPLSGHGSGVIVSNDGLIITAAHVVEGARAVAVHIPGIMGALPAEIVETDELRDVAFLRVVHESKGGARIAASGKKLKVRQSIFALGYPLDATRADPQSTRGVISGLLPDGRLQLGISVNPGNSGGPVIDESDTVHGIVVARSNVKRGEIGLAVAVPVAAFQDSLAEHLRAGRDKALTARLREKSRRQLADLVSVMAHEGFDILQGSINPKSERSVQRKQQVMSLYRKMPKSADAALLAAIFFLEPVRRTGSRRHHGQRFVEKGR